MFFLTLTTTLWSRNSNKPWNFSFKVISTLKKNCSKCREKNTWTGTCTAVCQYNMSTFHGLQTTTNSISWQFFGTVFMRKAPEGRMSKESNNNQFGAVNLVPLINALLEGLQRCMVTATPSFSVVSSTAQIQVAHGTRQANEIKTSTNKALSSGSQKGSYIIFQMPNSIKHNFNQHNVPKNTSYFSVHLFVFKLESILHMKIHT